MPLITPDELRTKLQRDLDEAVAQQACDLASAQVQTLTRQTLIAAEHVEHCELVARLWRRQLRPTTRLSQRPVTAVTTVTVDGAELDTALWDWDEASGLLAVTTDSDRATVEYAAGWDPIPADLKAAALHFAAAEVSNPTGIVSERIGDYSVTFGDTATGNAIKTILDGYRRKAGTVRVR